MIEKIRKHAKKILAGLALAKALTFGTPALAKNGFFNVQPGYKITEKENYSTVRFEGGSDITDNLKGYGYMDADASREKQLDMEDIYSEMRLSYSLGDIYSKLKNVGPAVEYNGGNNVEDIVRVGLTWTPEVHKDNFTLLKLYPYETSREKGPQVCLFTSQKIKDVISLNLLIDYNFDPKEGKKTIYVEPEVNVKLGKGIDGFVQGRGFSPTDDIMRIENWGVVVGAKYNF